MSEPGSRLAALYCPYCGEEDLEPVGEAGGWHCGFCGSWFEVRRTKPAVEDETR